MSNSEVLEEKQELELIKKTRINIYNGYLLNESSEINFGFRKSKYIILDDNEYLGNDEIKNITKSDLSRRFKIRKQKIKGIVYEPIEFNSDMVNIKNIDTDRVSNDSINIGKHYLSKQTVLYNEEDNELIRKTYLDVKAFSNKNPLKLKNFNMALIDEENVHSLRKNYDINTINNVVKYSIGNWNNGRNDFMDYFINHNIYIVGNKNDEVVIFKNNKKSSYLEVETIEFEENKKSMIIYLMEKETEFNYEINTSNSIFHLLNNIDNYQKVINTIEKIKEEYNEELSLNNSLSQIDIKKLEYYLEKINNFKENVSENDVSQKLTELNDMEQKLIDILEKNDVLINNINLLSRNILSNQDNNYNKTFDELNIRSKKINEYLDSKKRNGKNDITLFVYKNLNDKKFGNDFDGYYFGDD
jgi:hypothetical protein